MTERSNGTEPAVTLPGVPRQGFDLGDDDTPLPDLPPLPADPRWRVAHLPFLSAVSVALLLCAASVGFLAGGAASAVGAGLGVLIVTISYTMSTLVIAWADTVRPALLMPLAMLTYVLKCVVLGVALAYGVNTAWTGKTALGWGIVAGVIAWTGVQAWWFTAIRPPK
ncbi:hypothetical protein ODJ79_12875 [Actinoplanes sp. KI2]|uniref:hypothetical protein n=1 Tax=Actinoplanes sp. KI2 TaxID=2983315 RepID=UPI0021D5A7E5|nr:hypothetical protein [Actinoplanes sp. KI2]MCU7724613.1 hypothetical protein [Actinoplanes sp. KI2]